MYRHFLNVIDFFIVVNIDSSSGTVISLDFLFPNKEVIAGCLPDPGYNKDLTLAL